MIMIRWIWAVVANLRIQIPKWEQLGIRNAGDGYPKDIRVLNAETWQKDGQFGQFVHVRAGQDCRKLDSYRIPKGKQFEAIWNMPPYPSIKL